MGQIQKLVNGLFAAPQSRMLDIQASPEEPFTSNTPTCGYCPQATFLLVFSRDNQSPHVASTCYNPGGEIRHFSLPHNHGAVKVKIPQLT